MRLMKWFADFFDRHTLLVAAIVGIITIVLATGLPALTIDDEPRRLLESQRTDYSFMEKVVQNFHSDENECVILLTGPDMFAPKSVRAVRKIIQRLKALPFVDSSDNVLDVVSFQGSLARATSLWPADDASPEELQKAKETILKNPLVAGQLISNDAHSMLILINFGSKSLTVPEVEKMVAEMNSIIAEEAKPAGMEFGVTGNPPIRATIFETLWSDQIRFSVTAISLTILISYFWFQRLAAVLMVVAPPAIGVLWTMGAMGFFHERINVINSVLPTLVLVIGFTDAVHMVMDIRRSRSLGMPRKEAAMQSISTLGLAVFMAQETTAIGFASLITAQLGVIRRMGIACAAGSIIVFVVVVTLVPLMACTKLGDMLQLPQHEKHAARGKKFWETLARPILWAPRTICCVGIAVTGFLAMSFFELKPEYQLTATMPPHNIPYETLKKCDEQFGGALQIQVLVEWPKNLNVVSPEVTAALKGATEVLAEEPLIAKPQSVLDLLAILPSKNPKLAAAMLAFVPKESLNRYVRLDLHQAIITARIQDVGMSRYEPVFSRIEEKLAKIQEKNPDVHVTLTSSTVVVSRSLAQIIADLKSSLLSASIFIFFSIAIAFWSLRIGLISVVPNLLPLAITASLLYYKDRPMEITTVMVFSICLGIAVDETIHFCTRFVRERAVDGNKVEAVKRSFVAVGNAMMATSIILIVGLSTLFTSSVPVTRLFAELACMSLGLGIVCNLILTPAFVLWLEPDDKATSSASIKD